MQDRLFLIGARSALFTRGLLFSANLPQALIVEGSSVADRPGPRALAQSPLPPALAAHAEYLPWVRTTAQLH